MINKTIGAALILAGAAAGTYCTVPALAKDQPSQNGGAVISANALIGKEVIGEDGEQLGKLHDLVLAESGDPVLAILGVGAVNGSPDRLVALPFPELQNSGEGRIRVAVTRQQIAERAVFSYDDPSLLSLAPLGFGATDSSPEMTERDDYLETWGARIGTLAERMDARAKKVNLTAEYQLDQAWSNLQGEWRNLRQTSKHQWSRAAESFEAAVDAFEETWKAEDGEAAAQDNTK